MKKAALTFLLIVSLKSLAQPAFSDSSQAITIGYGVPSIYTLLLMQDLKDADLFNNSSAGGYSTTYTYGKKGIGPVFLKYERAIGKKLGIGISFAYLSGEVSETYSYKRNIAVPTSSTISYQTYFQAATKTVKSLSAGVRFNYHFGNHPWLDPYIGAAVGYNHTVVETTYGTNDSYVTVPEGKKEQPLLPVYVGLTFGTRYYFSDELGIYGEAGFDKWSFLQLGLSYRFNK